MAVAVPETETPTGLGLPDLRNLDHRTKLVLARWQETKQGYEDGTAFCPRRVRDLTVRDRLTLASDREADLAWEARERRRVTQSFVYFIRQYGSIQPEEGYPLPFDLWEEQIEVAATIEGERRVIVLKARQLGLTWIALHYAVWLMAFNPGTPKAKVLLLSKTGKDAQDLLDRSRKIIRRLPAYLRPRESARSRDSNWRMVLSTGAEMRSLMGTPEAARSFTATLLIFDEFAFYRNASAAKTWTAAQPTLRALGRAIVIATGNGEVGDGAAFCDLWRKDSGLVKIFLPYDVDPARRAAGWRERERKAYLTDEDFEQEYPETEAQAFAGTGAYKVYPAAGLRAAAEVGKLLDARLPELAKEGVEWGIDWGDFQTFALYGIGLPGGGLYVFDEVVLPHVEPTKASEQIIYRDPAGIPGATFLASAADAAPKGTNNTFAMVLREAYNAQPERFPRTHTSVRFSDFKEGGKERRGVNTVGYVKHLLDAAEDFHGLPDQVHGLLAISPRCQTLLAQMRNLERDVETGKVRKPALDPRHIERGDHGPDALVALAASRAAGWKGEEQPLQKGGLS